MIHTFDEAIRTRIEQVLPRLRETCDGPDFLSHYLGNGKDGTVFRLHNPDDDEDTALDAYAMKVWNPVFLSRSHETYLHGKVWAMQDVPFRVPRLIHEDQRLGCFVMERVRGETAYQAIFRRRRYVAESFVEKVQDCFRALNACGVDHHDSHIGNYMLTHVETVPGADRDVIVDAEVWIIDFGRSVESNDSGDAQQIEDELFGRIVPDPD
ncbi:hypothetical protein LBMAG42_56020 [Deltaproteobacteria bacterium]|nr:hypothetical protein LBMAG42_56020 [Deltaproteobacteria bacterium]